MRRGQTRYLHGRCAGQNRDGSRCAMGSSTRSGGGLYCRRHAPQGAQLTIRLHEQPTPRPPLLPPPTAKEVRAAAKRHARGTVAVLDQEWAAGRDFRAGVDWLRRRLRKRSKP